MDLQEPKVWNIKVVSFIAVPGTATLEQRKSAFAGTLVTAAVLNTALKKTLLLQQNHGKNLGFHTCKFYEGVTGEFLHFGLLIYKP